RPGLSARMCSAERATLQPCFSRPVTLSQNQSRRSSALPHAAAAQIGRAISNRLPTSRPKNSGGVTPTIGTSRSSTVSVRPMAAGNPNVGELLGARHGQVSEANRVDELKDGGVRADAQSQGEDGHDRVARTSSEHTHGVTKIAPCLVDPLRVTRIAAGVLLLLE